MRGFCKGLVCCSAPVDDSVKQKQKNGENKRKRQSGQVQKILLLGTGESGKSTFLKQMRIICGKKFTDVEICAFRDIIYDNVYKGVLFLIQARSTLQIPWSNGQNSMSSKAADQLEEHFQNCRQQRRERAQLGQPLWNVTEFLGVVPLLHSIWNDSSIRTTFDQRARLITEDFDYIPSNEDIVWSRRPTDAVIEEEVIVHGRSLIFIDVGGQTKERRKWCQSFTDMTSVLFLVASSHFDEMYLDKLTKEYRNKLREAMSVFECLINHAAFRCVSIILFFNKTDILREKVAARLSSIRQSFPDEFPPDADEFQLADVQNFLVMLFSTLVDPNPDPRIAEPMQRLSALQRIFHSNPVARSSSINSSTSSAVTMPYSDRATQKRIVYRHFTTAVDRNNIETVFNAMQDTILQQNLRRLMLS